MRERDRVGAIIVAAGEGSRMEGVDKMFAPLGDKPLLAEVVEAFHSSPSIDEVIVVMEQGKVKRGWLLVEEYGWFKVATICPGGQRRQDSVREGLERLSPCQWVVVHDGARPLVTAELIERGLDEAQESGAAIAAVPVRDTIKVISQDRFVQQTPQRAILWAAQTPQVFRFDILASAHEQVREDVTDDAMMVERLGHKVKVYMGSYENIKVTTPDDLAVAEVILRKRKAAP